MSETAELGYEERIQLIEQAFKNAPVTFVPALTIKALKLSHRAGCWALNGLSIVARKIEEKG